MHSIKPAVAILRRHMVRSPGVRPPSGSETPCAPALGGHSPGWSLPLPQPCPVCPVGVDLPVLSTSQEWTLQQGPLCLESRRRLGSLGAAASCRLTVMGTRGPGCVFLKLIPAVCLHGLQGGQAAALAMKRFVGSRHEAACRLWLTAQTL